MNELDGLSAIVTGAARGQGAAIAARLAEHGAQVLLTDVDGSGEEAAAQIGRGAYFLRHDVGDEAGWTDVVEDVVARHGRLDILVNNAGVFRPRPLAETALADMDWHYRINQAGAFLGMRAVIGPMREAGGGSIVNVVSGAAMRGAPGMFAYAASKWALRGMTRTASLELAPLGIRVNGIYPGLIDTPMLEANPPEHLQAMAAMVPLGRLGVTSDTSAAVLYLASPAAAYVTGAELSVDGGMSA